MSIRVARRTLLKTGIAAGVTVSATSVIAQHSPAKLSTHALDTYQGKPAAGIRIDFSRKEGDTWKLLKTFTADENGRVGEQGTLMNADTMAIGRYELLFYVEEYYKRSGVRLTDPAFLDTVPVRFAIFDAKQSYHVPLYFSPWGIMSYRGS
ncbi:MAG: hydroxyisourate hydrolase [Methyloceanibacter sp.]|jgi:5-hydroxyisourate hydrolase